MYICYDRLLYTLIFGLLALCARHARSAPFSLPAGVESHLSYSNPISNYTGEHVVQRVPKSIQERHSTCSSDSHMTVICEDGTEYLLICVPGTYRNDLSCENSDETTNSQLCQSCPTQTYQSWPNCRSCNPCTQCEDGEYEEQPCTGETDTVCSPMIIPEGGSTTSTPTQGLSSSEVVQETSSSQSTSTGPDDDSTGTTPVTLTQPEAIAHTSTKDYSTTVIVLAVFLVIVVVLLVIMTIMWWRERVKRYAPTVPHNGSDVVQLNVNEGNQQPDCDELPERKPLLPSEDVGGNPSLSNGGRGSHTQEATGGLDDNLSATMETQMINTNGGTGPGVVSGCDSARGTGTVTEGQQGRPADPGCGPALKVTAQIYSPHGGEQSQEVPSSSSGNVSDADDPRHAGKTGHYENLPSSRVGDQLSIADNNTDSAAKDSQEADRPHGQKHLGAIPKSTKRVKFVNESKGKSTEEDSKPAKSRSQLSRASHVGDTKTSGSEQIELEVTELGQDSRIQNSCEDDMHRRKDNVTESGPDKGCGETHGAKISAVKGSADRESKRTLAEDRGSLHNQEGKPKSQFHDSRSESPASESSSTAADQSNLSPTQGNVAKKNPNENMSQVFRGGHARNGGDPCLKPNGTMRLILGPGKVRSDDGNQGSRVQSPPAECNETGGATHSSDNDSSRSPSREADSASDVCSASPVGANVKPVPPPSPVKEPAQRRNMADDTVEDRHCQAISRKLNHQQVKNLCRNMKLTENNIIDLEELYKNDLEEFKYQLLLKIKHIRGKEFTYRQVYNSLRSIGIKFYADELMKDFCIFFE